MQATEKSIFDSSFDYLRLQVASGVFKKANLSNIEHGVFHTNSAVYAFDMRSSDIVSTNEDVVINLVDSLKNLNFHVKFNRELNVNLMMYVMAYGNAMFIIDSDGTISTSYSKSLN